MTSDTHYRGGRVEADDPMLQTPRQMRLPCFADGCPMPGTLWPGITQGGTGDRRGTCAWHYAVAPTDIPKVTQVLRDWICVSAEINEARRCLSGKLASDPAGLQHAFDAAWQRLSPMAAAWEKDLAPGNIHTSKGVDEGHRQGYADWAKHLERFIGARVVEVLSTRRPSPDIRGTQHTQYQGTRLEDEELPWQ